MALRGRFRRAVVAPLPPAPSPISAQARALLAGLPGDWAVLDGNEVLHASPTFHLLGVSLGGKVTAPELQQFIAHVGLAGEAHEREFAIGGIDVAAPPRFVRARLGRLTEGLSVLQIEDISAASRVDAMRRDFIATVSAQMLAPVDAVLEEARAMVKAARRDRPVTERARIVESEARRLSALVTDLTDIARLQAADVMTEAEEFELSDAVASAVASVGEAARDKRMGIDQRVRPLLVFGNRELLITAMRNLLENAVAYSEPHTKVEVHAEQHGNLVDIRVQDQGIGIAPEHQARIFERFFQVPTGHDRSSGTGLGLAVVQLIAQAHGGEVTVESEPGRGAVFTLRLPARRLHAEAFAHDERAGE